MQIICSWAVSGLWHTSGSLPAAASVSVQESMSNLTTGYRQLEEVKARRDRNSTCISAYGIESTRESQRTVHLVALLCCIKWMLKTISLVQSTVCQQWMKTSQTWKWWRVCTSCLTICLCSELPGTRPVVLQYEHTLLKMLAPATAIAMQIQCWKLEEHHTRKILA